MIWVTIRPLQAGDSDALVSEYIQVFKGPACSGLLISDSNECMNVLLFYYMSASWSANTQCIDRVGCEIGCNFTDVGIANMKALITAACEKLSKIFLI
jgi:hypothetical protein